MTFNIGSWEEKQLVKAAIPSCFMDSASFVPLASHTVDYSKVTVATRGSSLCNCAVLTEREYLRLALPSQSRINSYNIICIV